MAMREDGVFVEGRGDEQSQLDLLEWLAEEEFAAERAAMFYVPRARPTAPASSPAPVLVLHLSPAAMQDPYEQPFRLAGHHRRAS